MKLLPLNKGYFAQVDDEDFDWLNQWKWRVVRNPRNSTYYAKRTYRVGKRSLEKKKEILLHRQILGLTNSSLVTDHKDHNGLNCQRSNLRACTIIENSRNSSKPSNCSSIYKGVSRHKTKTSTTWTTTIQGRVIGRFSHTTEGEIQAAKLYDKVAKERFGEFANPNFK